MKLIRIVGLLIASLLASAQLVAQQQDSVYILGHLLTNAEQGYMARLSPETSNQIIPLTNQSPEWHTSNGFFAKDEYILPIIQRDDNSEKYILYAIYDSETWELKRTVKKAYSDYLLPESAIYVTDKNLIYMICLDPETDEYKWLSMSPDDFILSDAIIYPNITECFALCISPEGTIYGFSQDGYLCQIETTSGNAKKLFKVNDAGGKKQASFFDSTRNAIYRTIPTDNGTTICRYDLIAETETFLQLYPKIESIPAITYDKYANELRVPGLASDLQVSFQTDVNRGVVSFSTPDRNLNGDTLAEMLHTIISLDNSPIDTIETFPDTKYEKQYVFPDGEHTLTIQAYNLYGKGGISSCPFFAGYDMPLPVQKINLSTDFPYTDLSWDKPGSLHGGTINPEELRYKIIRYPDGVTIADQKGQTMTDSLPSVPSTYYYGITAYIPQYAAQEATSESFFYNCIANIPYTANKWSQEGLDAFTIDDLNNDGATWEYYRLPSGQSTVRYHYSTTNQADDCLYFPPMYLQAGFLYETKVFVHAGADEYAERFSIGLALSEDRGTPVERILTDQSIQTQETRMYRMEFSVPQDSIYRLYIHCSSEANHYMLYIDSLSIKSAGIASVPDSVSSFVLMHAPDTPNNIALQCMAPVRNINETAATLNNIKIYRDGTLIQTFNRPTPGETLYCTDSVTEINRYQYKAIASNDNGEGRTATREIVLGSYETPYSHHFNNDLGFYTIIDNNHDNNTWHLYKDRFTGCMRYLASETVNADDWLVTPPIFLSDTVQYDISVGCCAGLSFYPESMRIMLGRTPEPNALSIVVKDLKDFTFINDTSITAQFSIPVAGYYYLGLQAYSPADRYAILLRDLLIQKHNSASVPTVKEQKAKVWGYKDHIAACSHSANTAIVYDLCGQKIGTYPLSASYCEWAMPSGIYIVRIGNSAHKVIVP